MKKVIIASKNPVKLQAAKNGLERMFPSQEFECIGVSVPSNVSDQPMSDDETFRGAKNRADNASTTHEGDDFYIGIEGGIEITDGEMQAFAWIVIKSHNKYGKSRTGTFFLPKQVVNLIKEGKELGEADDIVFKRDNSKQKSGAVGILTGDIIDRTAYYTEAVILALIPFKNADLY
ncbi:inosine/xanthosine triphosphatase [Psychroflexus lacisalsi]|jgi:inosine/xanthosine triphosphatase|uniref:Probable inosine/xanthosine triphosphatase n=1 Tax=Psychroflexus lacisalsi TaxID=503928 RepID=A0ABP3VJZ4_9FLAO|nr:inosine/xanthosine triphosphatase [Psychroflexus lacisalsi]MBZ9619592.1 inosine/xanthosine triphosphatase [Psychroflexus lacisalsi]